MHLLYLYFEAFCSEIASLIPEHSCSKSLLDGAVRDHRQEVSEEVTQSRKQKRYNDAMFLDMAACQ